ncbi:MAG: tetratricopeptide repeat protein [Planctomycetota bacterium]|nr:tetratricopeptide repeat protein [Planctomycetota bacterium]
MRLERILAIALGVTLALLSGCDTTTTSDAKKESSQRWGRTRAQVVAEIADELLRVGKLADAEAKANEAITSDPSCVPARITLAKVYIEQGRYQSATAELTRLSSEGKESADTVYLLGISLEKQGRLKDSLACYYRAQGMTTVGYAPIAAAAEVLVAMGQPQKAREVVDRHLANAKGDVTMVEVAARLAMMLKEYPRAIELYRQCCDLDGENPGYRMALVRAQWLAGQYEDTLGTLTKLAQTRKYALSAWVYAMQGDCATELNRTGEARRAYREAVRLEPTTAGLWVKLARADLTAGAAEEAVRSADQAVALDPKSADAALILGYALLRNGQNDRAAAAMKEATGMVPDSVTAWCLLGKAQAALGDEPAARSSYGKAQAIEPDNATVKELLAALGSRPAPGTK